MSNKNALDESYDPILLFDKPALFTCLRIDRDTVPAGLFAYDIRHSDDDGIAATVENHVLVNHMGTVITSEPLDFGEDGYIRLDDKNGGLNFASEHDCDTIAEYQAYLLEADQVESMEPEQAPGLTMDM